jgi:hypothetical protein
MGGRTCIVFKSETGQWRIPFKEKEEEEKKKIYVRSQKFLTSLFVLF